MTKTDLRKSFRDDLVAYTLKEGGTWHMFRFGDSIENAHALMFSDGSEWDEDNGYRTNEREPRLILFTPLGHPLEELE